MSENQYPDFNRKILECFFQSQIGNRKWLAAYMFRSPARRARSASCRAFFDPNSQNENNFCRATYGFGLQVAFQYFRTSPWRRTTTFCRPTMLDDPLRLGICAHQLRRFRAGGPHFASNLR